MINIILVKTPNGDAIINIDEISSIKPENLSFKKCTIELKNKSHIDCIETPSMIYNKITHILN